MGAQQEESSPARRTGGVLWTFGHSTRSASDTLALLSDAAIERVADVRTIRGSRHNPQFGSDVMQEWLAQAGVDYRWFERLGGRRGKQPVDPAVNAGWTHPSFHRYADYAMTQEFAAGLAELQDWTERPTAIMCAEAVPWRCHRSLIATALVVQGWQVTHLMGAGQTVPHRIGAWGATPHVDARGVITYPA